MLHGDEFGGKTRARSLVPKRRGRNIIVGVDMGGDLPDELGVDAIARGEIPVVRLGRAIRVPGTWLRQAAGLSEPTTPSATT